MILVLDNYDSFTYNLVQYMGELGATMHVARNDALTVDDVEALASLKSMYREVFILRDIHHLSIEEVAETLEISRASVKTRLLRARLMLRDLLAPRMANGWFGREPFQKGEKPW